MMLAMKIISCAWRRWKSRLANCLRNKKNHFDMYKDLTQEDLERFVTKCESADTHNQYM
jgi:hypothetical protein